MCAKQRHQQTMSELAAYQKTCKSQSLQDHSSLPSEGQRSHQTCDDSSGAASYSWIPIASLALISTPSASL